MNNDLSIPLIIALFPLVAGLVIVQTNPYHALVVRGALGAITALVEALLGAADVALTEALVGTMLAITLYAVAVRSSLVLRLGILGSEADFSSPLTQLRTILNKRYLRLELIAFTNPSSLETALAQGEIHATCQVCGDTYQTQTRIPRIYEILQSELTHPEHNLTYLNTVEESS